MQEKKSKQILINLEPSYYNKIVKLAKEEERTPTNKAYLLLIRGLEKEDKTKTKKKNYIAK